MVQRFTKLYLSLVIQAQNLKVNNFRSFPPNGCWFFQYHEFPLLTHFHKQTCVSGFHSLHTWSKIRCHSFYSVNRVLLLLTFSRNSFCTISLHIPISLKISHCWTCVYKICTHTFFAVILCNEQNSKIDSVPSVTIEHLSDQWGLVVVVTGVCEYELAAAQGQQEAWFLILPL